MSFYKSIDSSGKACGMDCNGNPVERGMLEHPYTYTDHLIWVKDGVYITMLPKNHSVVYSDRLWQWDHNKFDSCCQKIWKNEGQYFDNRKPEDIEKFLSLYFNVEIELLKIGQVCNQNSGYPLWIFFYRQNKN